MTGLLKSKGNFDRRFPCPLCTTGLDVRQSKKGKPYVVCDPCGVQVFVRLPQGIQRFEQLVDQANGKGAMERLKEMESRYRKKCPECGQEFWIEPGKIATSWFDGKFEGYRCPAKGCKGVADVETAFDPFSED